MVDFGLQVLIHFYGLTQTIKPILHFTNKLTAVLSLALIQM